MPPNRPIVSVVLPCFNEEASLQTVVPEMTEQLTAMGMRHELVVVDDGSTDGTATVAAALSKQYASLSVVSHGCNRGYAAALSTGVAACSGEMILMTDADGQFTVGDLPRFLALIEGVDGVVGYRLTRRDGLLRRITSAGYNWLARRLFGITFRDTNCAFKLIRRSARSLFPLRSGGFLAGVEILATASARGIRLSETWVTHRPRGVGTSSVRVHHLLEAVAGLARLRRDLRLQRQR